MKNKKRAKIKCHSEQNVMLNLFQHLMFKRFRNKFGMTNFKAFTLAELLITLTIIGVIAAMTIPNLMQSWRKHQVEVGVKEAYSILSNAIKISESENGYYYDYKGTLEDYIIPYLKVSKKCLVDGNNYRKSITECMPITTHLLNSGTTEYTIYDVGRYRYVLSNGMSLGLGAGVHGVSWGGQIYFVVDINGNKGEQILGKDIFIFTLRYGCPSNSCQIQPVFEAGALSAYTLQGKRNSKHPAYSTAIDSNSLYTMEELMSATLQGGCNAEASASNRTDTRGSRCAAAIQRNGWKIPDDYPVKKW